MERIVVGQADDGDIKDITAVPIIRPEVFRDINMSAEQVVYDHHHPWVVSPDGLSLPLHRQGQFKRSEDDRWLMGKNIENLIDQAKRQAK